MGAPKLPQPPFKFKESVSEEFDKTDLNVTVQKLKPFENSEDVTELKNWNHYEQQNQDKTEYNKTITRTVMGLFSALGKIKSYRKMKSNPDMTGQRITSSDQTRVICPEDTVYIAVPHSKKGKKYFSFLLKVMAGVLSVSLTIAMIFKPGKNEKILDSKPIISNSKVQQAIFIDYTVQGRGLIYNCKEKTWHCTDKKNYILCRKNSKMDLPSCRHQGVFDSDQDCLLAMKQKKELSCKIP